MKTKICCTCRQTLPLSEFYRETKSPDGVRRQCKKCHIKTNQKYIERNRDLVRIKRRDYMRKYRIGGPNGYVRVKNKRDYPNDEKCEVCKEKVHLVYHHWDNSNFAKGMWICTKCHVAAHWLEKYTSNIYYDLKRHLSQ